MAYPAIGEPTQAFIDAVRSRLLADATLTTLLGGNKVYGHLSEAARVEYPYLVLGRRHHDGNAGAMQTPGAIVSVQIDGWSDHKGPSEMHALHARCYLLLLRYGMSLSGYDVLEGSLTREFAEVFDEPDEDSPDRRLYHGVQRWISEIHQA